MRITFVFVLLLCNSLSIATELKIITYPFNYNDAVRIIYASDTTLLAPVDSNYLYQYDILEPTKVIITVNDTNINMFYLEMNDFTMNYFIELDDIIYQNAPTNNDKNKFLTTNSLILGIRKELSILHDKKIISVDSMNEINSKLYTNYLDLYYYYTLTNPSSFISLEYLKYEISNNAKDRKDVLALFNSLDSSVMRFPSYNLIKANLSIINDTLVYSENVKMEKEMVYDSKGKLIELTDLINQNYYNYIVFYDPSCKFVKMYFDEIENLEPKVKEKIQLIIVNTNSNNPIEEYSVNRFTGFIKFVQLNVGGKLCTPILKHFAVTKSFHGVLIDASGKIVNLDLSATDIEIK